MTPYVPDFSEYVVHLNMSYEKLGEYSSVSAAAVSVFGTSGKRYIDGIGSCCHLRLQSYKNHLFFFKKDYDSNNYPIYSFTKKVEVYKDGILLGIFPSINKAASNFKFGKRQIKQVCEGIKPEHNGYVFKYSN